MFNVALIDDTLFDQEHLKSLLDEYEKSKGVDFAVYCFDSASNFFDKYHAQYDLVFMDIEMPSGENGLEIAKRLLKDNPDIKLIFASSFVRYAIEGYQANAISFLSKPVERHSLFLALDRAIALIENGKNDKIMLSNKTGTKVFLLKDIIYFESFGHTCVCHSSDGATFSCTNSIKDLEERFAEKNFFRVKSSYLINLAYVERIDVDTVTVKGEELTISRRIKKSFVDAFTRYIGNFI
ncbi:MAG: LytTR family DNA-binding domain-containing protein [Bacilli bacterium]|nr:LytTR family DNA-binding domain-containing protein [Bacilli bacterium]